jgi:serine/threonine protein kinase
VLYQVFTGLTPSAARARYSVPQHEPVPAASLVNPLLDESISDLLGKMLDRDPAQRPHSLRLVEHVLEDVCEYLDLVHSRDAVASWWETSEIEVEDVVETAPAPKVVAAPPAAPKPGHRPTVRVAREDLYEEADDDFDEDDDARRSAAPGPLRFDAWAFAACAFGIVAFVVAATF